MLLSVPKPRQGWTLPWSAFPVSFQEDKDRWLTRRGGDNLLDDESLTRTIRQTTLRKVAFTLREAASALVRTGTDVAAVTSLAILVEPDGFRRICQFLLDRHHGPTQHIHDVARELAFMARHHAKLPDAEMEKLRRMCRRLRIKRTGLTATVRKRLAVIEEPRNLHRLVLLPTELMKLAGKLRRAPRKAPLMAETAVGIELLLMTAMRRKNLAGLRLGRHVLLDNDPRQPQARIVLDEADTKNGQPLEFELPEASARLLITIMYYTGLETEAAARQFDKTILELREQARQAIQPRRRGGRR